MNWNQRLTHEEIQQAIAHFLANGGKITILQPSPSIIPGWEAEEEAEVSFAVSWSGMWNVDRTLMEWRSP